MQFNKINPYFLFFLLLCIPFSVYFFRADLIGMDSYGTLLYICHGDNTIGLGGMEQLGQYLLFSLIPCNIWAIKVLLFCASFISGCFIIKMATLFSEKNGWRASYLLFLSSVTVLEFTKFENDTFAFPILFASLYFFWHGMKKQNRKSFAISLALLLPAGTIWAGSIYYLIAYALNLWVLIPFVLIMAFFPGQNHLGWRQLLGNIIRTGRVAEDLALKLHSHLLLNFGLWGLVFEPVLLPQGLMFFAMGLISNKFWILSLPFLTIGAVKLLETVDRQWLNQFVAIASIIMLLGISQSVLTNPPKQEHWEAIDFALDIDNNVNNPWGWGYWVRWRGGETSSYSTFHRQQPLMPNQLMITEEEMECQILQKFGQVKVYRC